MSHIFHISYCNLFPWAIFFLTLVSTIFVECCCRDILSATFELHDDFMHCSLLSRCFQILTLACCSFQHCISLLLSLPLCGLLLICTWLLTLCANYLSQSPMKSTRWKALTFAAVSKLFFFSAAFLCWKSSILSFKSELFTNNLL